MSDAIMTPTGEAEAIRKRVCKACDRCRLKKSKCDGSNPCLRCKADNSICVFGERKRSHDKIYPKGYVEMLEQQQGQLVTALQEIYKRSLGGQPWPGPELPEPNGYPLTHDILVTLGLLEPKNDGSGAMEGFEEDCGKLQAKLLAQGAVLTRRRGSISSDSETAQPTRSASHTVSNNSKRRSTKGSLKLDSESASPKTPQLPMAGAKQKARPSKARTSPTPPQSRSNSDGSGMSREATRNPLFAPSDATPPQSRNCSQIEVPPGIASPYQSVPNDPQFYQAQWTLPNYSCNPAQYQLVPEHQQPVPDMELDEIFSDNHGANSMSHFDFSSKPPSAVFNSFDFQRSPPTTAAPQELSTRFTDQELQALGLSFDDDLDYMNNFARGMT